MSLIWIWFIANNLIDLLKAIGLLLRIPDTFLGMTVLTYGNSISDLVLNISLVKSGYGEMALAGSISGPLFNLLVGLGSSLLKMNISHGTIAIDFYSTSNIISVIAVFILILNLLLLLYQSHSHEYILNKRFISYSGFIIYATFLMLICYNTFLQ
jgi:sodium/potassium/calcium exchanger 6